MIRSLADFLIGRKRHAYRGMLYIFFYNALKRRHYLSDPRLVVRA